MSPHPHLEGLIRKIRRGIDIAVSPGNRLVIESTLKEWADELEAAIAAGGVGIVGWLHEDTLPDGYPYDAMFPHSKVDGVRMFPVYAPLAQALAALPGGGVEGCLREAIAQAEADAEKLYGPKRQQLQRQAKKWRAALPTPNPHEADRNG